ALLELSAPLRGHDDVEDQVQHSLLDRAAFGIEVRRMVVQLEKAERTGIEDREVSDPVPQLAELLASRRHRRKFVENEPREPQLLLAVDRVDQCFLRLEVAIDRACTDAGALGDLRDRSAVEAALDEQLERRVHDRIGLVAAAALPD